LACDDHPVGAAIDGGWGLVPMIWLMAPPNADPGETTTAGCRAKARTSRWRRAAAVASVSIVAAGCAASPVPAPPDAVGTRIDNLVAARIMNQPLVTQSGAITRLSTYRGKIVLVSDMMTLCQETCPIDTATLVQTARAAQRAGLGGRVEFLSITVDPQRDRPARLAAYRALYAPAPPNWQLLTGSVAAISALWSYLGVYYQRVPEQSPPATDWMTGRRLTYDVNHADLVFFIDPAGHERFAIDGAGHAAPGTVLAPRLNQFLDDAGRANLTHPGVDTWTASQALTVISWLANRPITS
jgi:protein SCO1/2